MPIAQKIELNDAFILVWQVNESEEELLKLVDSRLVGHIKNIASDKTRLSALASRAALTEALQITSTSYQGIKKDEFGKPHLINSDKNISVSHTDSYAAVIISKMSFVGVDIETKHNQTFRLKDKYCSQHELDFIDNDKRKSTIIWSAKESIYKGYGRKKLIFAEDMKLISTANNELLFEFSKVKQNLSVNYFEEKNYSLTYVNLDIPNS